MLGRDLPEDVLMEIQSRLPVKTLMRFKCISKSWYALTTNPYFITKHLTSHNPHTGAIFALNSLMNPQRICWLSNETLELSGDEVHTTQLFQDAVRRINFFGPCNGILCLAGTLKVKNRDLKPDYVIVLWNPATRESKMLPPMDLPTSTFKSNFGFGYDSKTNDYKVVRILSFDSHCEVVVYSLSSNSWRKINSTPNPSYLIDFSERPGYLNGVHHWSVGGGVLGLLDFFRTVRPFLLSFDMSNEVFQEVLGPVTGAFFTMQVTIVNDSVTLILRCTDLKEDWYEIWVLNDSGVKRPWTKISTIRLPPDLSDMHLLKLREDGSLVLLHDEGDLVLYDPRTQELRHLPLYSALDARIISYTESLVFLNGGNKTIHNKIPHHLGDRASNSFS